MQERAKRQKFVIFFFRGRVIPVAQSDRAGEVTTQRCDTHSSGSLISAPLWTFKLSAPAISKLLVPALLCFEEKRNTEVSRKWKVISCASSANTKHRGHKESPHQVTCKCHLPAAWDSKPQPWGWPPLFSMQEVRVWYPGDKKTNPCKRDLNTKGWA